MVEAVRCAVVEAVRCAVVEVVRCAVAKLGEPTRMWRGTVRSDRSLEGEDDL